MTTAIQIYIDESQKQYSWQKKKKYIEEYIMMFLNIKLRAGKTVWYII